MFPRYSDPVFAADLASFCRVEEVRHDGSIRERLDIILHAFDLYEADMISYEDALRNADSLNDLRLAIKLHGKDAKARNVMAGIGNLDIVQ